MNKTELIAEVAEKAGLSKKDAEAAVKAVIDSVTDALVDGDKVQLGRLAADDKTDRRQSAAGGFRHF